MALPRRDARPPSDPRAGLLMGDHVHVDLAGLLHDRRADALVEDAGPAGPPRRAEHQLGGVHLAGEIQQRGWARRRRPRCAGWRRGWSASSRTLPICGADTPDSPSPRTTCTTISSALDFDAIRDALRTRVSDSGPPVTATTTRSRASQVSVILFSARYFSSAASTWSASHSSASSRSAVRLPRPEVVRQRGVDPLGGVDVAVGEPAPQRFRGDVDQFDLVGGAHHLVGHLLLLLDAGDLGDDVVEALQVLDVDRGDHGDAGVEQLLDVLPALGVLAARGVGVGQFVDQHHLRAARAAPRRTSSSGKRLPRYSM